MKVFILSLILILAASAGASHIRHGVVPTTTQWQVTVCEEASWAGDFYIPIGAGSWTGTQMVLKNMDFTGSIDFYCASIDVAPGLPWRVEIRKNGSAVVSGADPQFWSSYGYYEYCRQDFGSVQFVAGDSLVGKFDEVINGAPTITNLCLTVGGGVHAET